MIYDFQHAETGRLVELEMSPDEVPLIGGSVMIDGAEYIRIPSLPGGSLVRRDVAHVSHQLPRKWNGPGPDPAPRRDSRGRPVFHNRKETVEYAAKTGTEYDQL